MVAWETCDGLELRASGAIFGEAELTGLAVDLWLSVELCKKITQLLTVYDNPAI